MQQYYNSLQFATCDQERYEGFRLHVVRKLFIFSIISFFHIFSSEADIYFLSVSLGVSFCFVLHVTRELYLSLFLFIFISEATIYFYTVSVLVYMFRYHAVSHLFSRKACSNITHSIFSFLSSSSFFGEATILSLSSSWRNTWYNAMRSKIA